MYSLGFLGVFHCHIRHKYSIAWDERQNAFRPYLHINNLMPLDKNIFKNQEDYWLVAENIRDIYLSDGSLLSLIDFERVLDELDLYAFRNWPLGELVAGPEIGRYTVTCTFMWPERLMPDPRGARVAREAVSRYYRTRNRDIDPNDLFLTAFAGSISDNTSAQKISYAWYC